MVTPHAGALPAAGPPGATGFRGPGPGRGPGPARARFTGPLAGVRPGASPPFAFGGGLRAFGRRMGGVGGILQASQPSDAVVAALREDADRYRWVAAVVSANQAAGYQLASDRPVMAIGGFNGTDPAPTLEQLQSLVAAGEIHWFITGRGGFGTGPMGGGESSPASAITAWVTSTFPSTTIDGTTLYDLTSTR